MSRFLPPLLNICQVGESLYFTDEDCDIPITNAATEVAIAKRNTEDRSGGVDGGKINNESGQASTDSREDVSSHEPSPSPRRNRNIWEIGDRYRVGRAIPKRFVVVVLYNGSTLEPRWKFRYFT